MDANMKPRASIPAITVDESANEANSLVTELKAAPFESKGVMSLKRIPGFGKFGTSRMSCRA